MTIEELKQLRKDQQPTLGYTEFHEVVTNEYAIVGYLIDIIEAQDARIKALEQTLATSSGISDNDDDYDIMAPT